MNMNQYLIVVCVGCTTCIVLGCFTKDMWLSLYKAIKKFFKNRKKKKKKKEMSYKKKYNELKGATDAVLHFVEIQNTYMKNQDARIQELTRELDYYKHLFDRRN